MTSSAPVPVSPRIASASGACLRDIEGRDYLDLSAGYGSVWLGHQHPAVTTAIESQLRLHAAPGFFEDGTRERAEAALLPLLPSTHVVAGIYSTGMEAVETALRAARAASGRLAVAGFSGSTHGRSLLTGSLGAWEANEIPGVAYRLPAYSVGAEALVAAIEALTAKVELAAILVEPVQMTNGGHALPQAAADALFALAQARGVTVVFDETLTGLYRCGAALYADRLGHVPPLVVMGKGIANGFPAAAVAHHVDYPWERARVRPGSTFWNHPVTCAAIAATLETLEASEPKARVTQIETVIQRELGDLVLRGSGAMWCLELPNAAQQPAFIARLLDARVVVSYYDRHIRLLPPLMIDPDALALGCARSGKLMLLRAGEIVLRPFSLDLSTTAYDIRNHESVRRNMGDPSPIGRAAHDVWVRVNLLEAQCVHLFIVEAGAEAIGLALLRNFKGDAAEIGLMVQEAHRRPLACYKAAHLIGYYGFEVLDLANLVSLVPRHNARALEFNRACGFEESAARSTAVYHALELDQARSRSHPTHRKFRARYRVQILES